MILKLLDEPTDEPTQFARVPIVVRLVGSGVAFLVAFIPAITAVYGAYHLTKFLRSMTNPQTVSSAAEIVSTMLSLNKPLVIGLGVSALLALGFALVLAINPGLRLASVGLPSSIATLIIAAGPALLLWSAETHILEALERKVGSQAEVAATANTITLLMFWALLFAVLAVPASFVAPLVSLLRSPQSRSDALSTSRAMIWLFVGVLLLVFSGVYLILG